MYTIVISLLIFIISAIPAHAGQLLISLDLKFSKFNGMSEKILSHYLAKNIKSNYRKVYIISKSSGDETFEILQRIKNDRIPDEFLDIVSIQHGPDTSLFWDMELSEFKEVIGEQKIRFVLSSGCQMWGKLYFDERGQIAEKKTNNFTNKIKKLDPEEILLFANDQSYTLYLIIEILKLNQSSRPLNDIFVTFFDKMDIKNSKLLEKLSNAIENENWIRADYYSNLSVNPSSRPIFISKDNNSPYYSERILPIPSDLWSSYYNLCLELKLTTNIKYKNMGKAICNFSR